MGNHSSSLLTKQKLLVNCLTMKYASKYNTPEYRKKYTGMYGSWYAMKQRCNNPKNKQFKDYGGRGISYPKNWESFDGFREEMGSSYTNSLTIDRIDNNKNYSMENCRWATRKQQNNNKRSNIVLTFNGQTYPLAIWSEKLGMSFDVLRSRFYRGMPLEKILSNKRYSRWDKK